MTRALAWPKAKAEQASAWAFEARESHASVDVGFRVADRDKRVAAGVLAGGVAYRFFFWLVALSLINIGALGAFGGSRVADKLADWGFGPVVVEFVDETSRNSQAADWSLVVVGVLLLLSTGYTCVKALVLVHATIWSVPAPRIRNPLVASLAFSGLVFAFAASTAAARALRTESASVGLIATLALIVLPFAIWLWASLRLPRGDLGWQELLPGVVLVAVGVQAMHIFTTLYLGPKLTHATELYEHGDDAVRAEVSRWEPEARAAVARALAEAV